MADFDSLDASLGLLYNYAHHFRVSIDLVQKLAQYLKLDTFVDTEVPAADNLKRLSIAGSLLLVDIDFDSNSPSKVSLSSGNHPVEDSSAPPPPDPLQHIALEQSGDHPVVKINFKLPGHMSFLQVRHKDCSVAEHILLSNLSLSVLGNFPANLKYLANLDSMSPPEADLVVYMDNVAVYLGAIHATEEKLNSDWQVLQGYESRIGKVGLNDMKEGRLGVVVLFWEENRHIEHARLTAGTESTTHPQQKHKAILSIEESPVASRDYLQQASEQSWLLRLPDGSFKEYTFTFDADLHLHKGQSVTSVASRNWALVLNLLTPVHLPVSVIDYLGLHYELCPEPVLSEEFERLSTGKVEFDIHDLFTVLVSTDEICEYRAVKSIRLENLVQVSEVMPILRNYLAFTALIRNIAKLPGALLAKNDPNEVSKKLKDSLKLSGEVADEELAGLGTMESDYMAVPLIGSDTDLSDFMKTEGDDMEDDAPRPGLLFVVSDILYDSPDTDLVMSVDGVLKGQRFSGDFVIRNGQIQTSGDVDMDASTARDYCRALALSEDPLLALDVI